MAIEPQMYESDPTTMLPVHKEEEDVLGIPGLSGYPYNPVFISEELEHIHSRSNSSTSSPSQSPCSSPMSMTPRSLEASSSSSSSSPSPQDPYRTWYLLP